MEFSSSSNWRAHWRRERDWRSTAPMFKRSRMERTPPAIATLSRPPGSCIPEKPGEPNRTERVKASSVRLRERVTSSRSVSGWMDRAIWREVSQQVSSASISSTLSSSSTLVYFGCIIMGTSNQRFCVFILSFVGGIGSGGNPQADRLFYSGIPASFANTVMETPSSWTRISPGSFRKRQTT